MLKKSSPEPEKLLNKILVKELVAHWHLLIGLTWHIEVDLSKNAIDQDSPVMNKLTDFAKENKIAIGVGYYEKYSNSIFQELIV